MDYLQAPPVGAIGQHEETLLLEGPKAQGDGEVLLVLVHAVDILEVGLVAEPQRRF